MKRTTLILKMLVMVMALVPSVARSQSRQDAIRLHKEAIELQKTVVSQGDVQRVEAKLRESLSICERTGFKKGAGVVALALGAHYKDRGDYPKALELYGKSLAIDRELKDRAGEARTLGHLAVVYDARGQYDQALELYGKCLTMFRELKDRRLEGIVLANVAGVLKSRSQYDKALEYYEKSLAIKKELKDRSGEASILDDIAVVHKVRGQYDTALNVYGKSLAICREIKERRLEAVSLAGIGGLFTSRGDYNKAMEFYEKSLAIRVSIRDRRGEAFVLDSMAALQRSRGHYERALELYGKSLAIFRELKDRRVEGGLLDNIGETYKYMGKSDRALELFEKALAVKKDLMDRRGVAYTLSRISGVHSVRGDNEKALDFCRKALAIRREIRDRYGEGAVITEMANLYKSMGRYETALELYEKGLAIDRELKDRAGEAVTLVSMGDVNNARNRYDQALALYERVLAIRREIKDRGGESLTLNRMAETSGRRGEYDKALGLYGKSLAIRREIKDRLGEGIALTGMGDVNKWRGQFNEALDLYGKSLAIRRELKHRYGEAENLAGIAGLCKSRGEYDKAVGYYEQALALHKELKNRAGEAYALSNIADVHLDRGQYDKAMEMYEKTLALRREAKDRAGEGSALAGIGRVLKSRGKYDKAMEMYEQSLTIRRELKNRQGEGALFMSMAGVYESRGQYGKALELYEKGLDIDRELKDRVGEIASLDSMASLYKARGQYDKALELFERSLVIERELKDRQREARTLNRVGLVYYAKGQHDKALGAYEKSLRIAKKIKDSHGQGVALGNMGQIYAAQEHRLKAMECFAEHRSLFKANGLAVNWPNDLLGNLYLDSGDLAGAEPLLKEANYWPSLGRLCLMKSDYQGASKYFQKLLGSARKNRNPDDLFKAYTGLGLACEGMGELDKAVELFQSAIRSTEEVRAGLGATEREGFLEVRLGGLSRTAPYEGLARVLMRLNRPAEALKASESSKARVFAESMSRSSGGRSLDVPGDVLAADTELNTQLAAMQKNLQQAYEHGQKEAIAGIEPQFKELERKLLEHKTALRRRYPLFAAIRYPEPMDIAQSALREHEWVLSYDVTDSGVIVYLTKGVQIVWGGFKPIPRKDLDYLVRTFRAPLDMTEGRIDREKLAAFDFLAGKQLSDILLTDAMKHLPPHIPVTVVPDDSLGVLPFEMLVLNHGGAVHFEGSRIRVSGAEFFGDRNPVSYYQSITALSLARTLGRPRSSSGRLLVVNDPVFSDDDERVPRERAGAVRTGAHGLPDDVMSVKNGIGLTFGRLAYTGWLGASLKGLEPGNVDLLTGIQASKENLLRLPLSQYGAMVFATHGYFGTDMPGIREPVLVLSLGTGRLQESCLTLTEVMGLKLNADIVALTACQTGVGKQISGEGTMGMGRAFQYAGAKCVLMSLWSVSEHQSVTLVEHFFRHLKEGDSRIKALSKARHRIRQQGYDHPFYWAPFILVGEAN